MLSLTRKTEYALIAVCHLARTGGDVISAREISERYDVRLPLLMNVLKTLNQAGLLRSERGAKGGYRLAVPPPEITLGDVIEAVEGPAKLVRCAPPANVNQSGDCCELVSSCPVRLPLAKIDDRLKTFLRNVTIAEIAFDGAYAVTDKRDDDDRQLRVIAR